MSWNKPTKVKCDKCQSIMVEKGKKIMCINDECKNVVSVEEEFIKNSQTTIE